MSKGHIFVLLYEAISRAAELANACVKNYLHAQDSQSTQRKGKSRTI